MTREESIAREEAIAIWRGAYKPSDDCISRQAVMGCIDEYSQMIIRPIELMECIYKLPPVTPQPKIGRWLTWKEAGNEIPSETRFECSVCHDTAQTLCNGLDLLSSFCPNCGARMAESEDK